MLITLLGWYTLALLIFIAASIIGTNWCKKKTIVSGLVIVFPAIVYMGMTLFR